MVLTTLAESVIGLSFVLGKAAFIGDSNELGVYGVSLAAIGMLAITGVIVAVDAYGLQAPQV